MLYKVRTLPRAVISPPKGLIISKTTHTLICARSMVMDEWFPEIFGGSHTTTTLTLVASTSIGRASSSVALPADLSTLSNLPLKWKFSARQLIMGIVSPERRLSSLVPLTLNPVGESFCDLQVHLSLHNSTDFLPCNTW